MPIIQNDTPFGIATEKISEAYVQQSIKTLSYSFDLSPLIQASHLFNEINDTCSTLQYPLMSLELQLMDIQLWNSSKSEDDNTSQTFFRPLSSSKLLEISMHKFTSHIGRSKCKLLPNITENIYDMNSELIPLSKANFSTFYSLITKSQLITDIKTVISEELLSNCTLPFDFNENFDNFFEHTTFKFGIHEQFLKISFKIPIFTKNKQNVYKIVSITKTFHGLPYVLRSNFSLLINDTEKFILFGNETFKKFCPWILQARFCHVPEHKNGEEHPFEVSSFFPQDVQDKFFVIRLPKQNTATKIGNNFYFSVFSPFDLHVFCPQSNYSIHITKSIKIENNTVCALKTPFFKFIPSIYDNGFVHVTKWLNESKETEGARMNGKSIAPFIYIIIFIFLGFIIIIIITLIRNVLNKNTSPLHF